MSTALSTAIPAPTSDLSGYLRAVNAFPMLTEDEELSLARRLRDHDDVNAAWRLVTSHLRFVAKRLVGWLETAVLSNLPGYSFMRNLGEEYAGGAPTSTHESVLVRLDDAYQLGFLVERLASGHVVVFVPGAPRPWDGNVLIVEQSRVTVLSSSSKVAVKCLQQLGSGTGKLVQGNLESA